MFDLTNGTRLGELYVILDPDRPDDQNKLKLTPLNNQGIVAQINRLFSEINGTVVSFNNQYYLISRDDMRKFRAKYQENMRVEDFLRILDTMAVQAINNKTLTIIGKVQFENCVYTGPTKGGKPEGWGILEAKGNETYEGFFVDGKLQGDVIVHKGTNDIIINFENGRPRDGVLKSKNGQFSRIVNNAILKFDDGDDDSDTFSWQAYANAEYNARMDIFLHAKEEARPSQKLTKKEILKEIIKDTNCFQNPTFIKKEIATLEADEIVDILTNLPDNIPFFEDQEDTELAPILDKLSPEQLYQIFSKKNPQGTSLIHQPSVFLNVIPYLEKICSEDGGGEKIRSLIYETDKKGDNILDLLLNSVYYLKVTRKWGGDGFYYDPVNGPGENVATYYTYSHIKALGLFAELDLDKEDVKRILARKTSPETKSLFINQREFFLKSLPLFKKLTSQEIMDIFIIDNVTTIEFRSMELFLKEFKDILTQEQLIKVLTTNPFRSYKNLLMNAIEYGYISFNTLQSTLGYDLDFEQLIPKNDKKTKELFVKEIKNWLKISIKEKNIYDLYLAYYLDMKEEFVLGLNQFNIQERNSFYKKFHLDPLEFESPEFESFLFLHSEMPLVAEQYEITPQHFKEVVHIDTSIPEALPMENVPFVARLHSDQPETFHSFIPNFIRGAVEDLLGTEYELNGDTQMKLLEMANKIRTNEFIYGMNIPNQEGITDEAYKKIRDEAIENEYRIFCSYLTHVIKGYTLGQKGGDLEDKKMILNNLAECTQYCFPRWKKGIQQDYTMINSNSDKKEITVRDRILAQLQSERIYILSERMLMYDERVHEPNYLLDLFREEFGTGLNPTNDPHILTPAFLSSYGKDKNRLRNEFFGYYNILNILRNLTFHINQQHANEHESKFIQDLPPQQVTEWLKERVATSWKQEQYDQIASTVRKMQNEKKSNQEIDLYLKSFGIERRQEETVEDAESRLKNEWQMKQKYDRHRLLRANLVSEIEEIFNDDNKGKRNSLVANFLSNRGLSGNQYYNKQQLIEEVDRYIYAQKKKDQALENLLAKLNNADLEEKKILLKDHLIHEQPFDEVITPAFIKEAQINKFFDDVVYREINGRKIFTPEATALLLETMGILEEKGKKGT